MPVDTRVRYQGSLADLFTFIRDVVPAAHRGQITIAEFKMTGMTQSEFNQMRSDAALWKATAPTAKVKVDFSDEIDVQ